MNCQRAFVLAASLVVLSGLAACANGPSGMLTPTPLPAVGNATADQSATLGGGTFDKGGWLPPDPPPPPLPPLVSIDCTTVAQGPSSQILEPRTVVARSAVEWQELWKQHTAALLPGVDSSKWLLPDVDFSNSIVVGVFLGTRPSTGYSVEITAVRSTLSGLVVEYRELGPEPGAVVAQVLTSPFHLVTVPILSGLVEFKRVD